MNYSKHTCYMCDAQKTTDEHVPPKGLFPKAKDFPNGRNLRKQLITVPSCDAHNIEKSQDDEYLMYALVFGIKNNAIATNQVRTKIQRAIKDNPTLAKMITQNYKKVTVIDNVSGKQYETIAVTICKSRVYQALKCIGRALHYHHFKNKWTEEIQVIPLFLLSLDGESPQMFNDDLESMGNLIDYFLTPNPWLGANPEVFRYKTVKFNSEPSCVISAVMLLSFYEGTEVILLFKNSSV